MGDYIHTDEFLADFASGKERAFRALHQEFFAKLTTTADGIVKNYMKAEEISIDSLVRLMKGYQNFADGSLSFNRLKNHLYLSVRSLCFDHLRSSSRTTCATGRDVTETLGNIYDEGNVEGSVAYAEFIACLHEILDGLPEERRMALQLKYFKKEEGKGCSSGNNNVA